MDPKDKADLEVYFKDLEIRSLDQLNNSRKLSSISLDIDKVSGLLNSSAGPDIIKDFYTGLLSFALVLYRERDYIGGEAGDKIFHKLEPLLDGANLSLEKLLPELASAPPYFVLLRGILEYLSSSNFSAKANFKHSPLWIKLEQIFSSESARKVLSQLNNREQILLGLRYGSGIKFEVMQAAADLFNIQPQKSMIDALLNNKNNLEILRVIPDLVKHFNYDISQETASKIFGLEFTSEMTPYKIEKKEYLEMCVNILDKVHADDLPNLESLAIQAFHEADCNHLGLSIMSKVVDMFLAGSIKDKYTYRNYYYALSVFAERSYDDLTIKDAVFSKMFALSQQYPEFMLLVLQKANFNASFSEIWPALSERLLGDNKPLKLLHMNPDFDSDEFRMDLDLTMNIIIFIYNIQPTRLNELVMDLPPYFVSAIADFLLIKHETYKYEYNYNFENTIEWRTLKAIFASEHGSVAINQSIANACASQPPNTDLIHSIIDTIKDELSLKQLMVPPDFLLLRAILGYLSSKQKNTGSYNFYNFKEDLLWKKIQQLLASNEGAEEFAKFAVQEIALVGLKDCDSIKFEVMKAASELFKVPFKETMVDLLISNASYEEFLHIFPSLVEILEYKLSTTTALNAIKKISSNRLRTSTREVRKLYLKILSNLTNNNKELLNTPEVLQAIIIISGNFTVSDTPAEIKLNVLKSLASGAIFYEYRYFDVIVNFANEIFHDANLKDTVVRYIIDLTKNVPVFLKTLLGKPIKAHEDIWNEIIDQNMDNIIELRSKACDNGDIITLTNLIKVVNRKNKPLLTDFIIDLPSFRTIRVILGYLSKIENFTDDDDPFDHPLWIMLKEVVASESGKKILEQFTAEALVGWVGNPPVNYKVMSAASQLFNLDAKIKENAVKNKNFNPILLSIERLGQLDPSENGVMAHYISHPGDFEYLAQLNVADKLLILEDLLIDAEDFALIENYAIFIKNFITAEMLASIDSSFIVSVLGERDVWIGEWPRPLVPETLKTILEQFGYGPSVRSNTLINFTEYFDNLMLAEDIINDPIKTFLAGELQVGLIMPQRTTKTGLQSSHDEVLEGLFNEFVESQAIKLSENKLDTAETQIDYIRIFTLFELYRTNPRAEIFKELLNTPLVRNLFENNKNFDQFFKKYARLRPEQISESGLLYAITGKLEGLNRSKKIIIDQAIAEKQEDNFAMQAMFSFRAVRGIAGQALKSNFLIDDGLRAGTVALISYIYSAPNTLENLITSHEDVMDILYRLPNDSAADIANNLGVRTKLLEIYKNNKDLPFNYAKYKDLLESIFNERMAHNKSNICQYMGESITAYSETTQSCVTGCKVRMFTLLLGDMLYGITRSRLYEIQDYVYESVLAQLKIKLALVESQEDKLQILSSFLSTNKYNASLYAVDKHDELIATYGDTQPTILPLTDLFDVDSIDNLFSKLKDGFNINSNYNLDGKHALNAAEEQVMRVLLRIGGGEAVMKRLDGFFRPIYGPKNVDMVEIDIVRNIIIGLLNSANEKTTFLLPAQEDQIQKQKIKNLALRIVKMQQGKDYVPEYDLTEEEHEAAIKVAIELLADAKGKTPAELREMVAKLATNARPHSPTSRPKLN